MRFWVLLNGENLARTVWHLNRTIQKVCWMKHDSNGAIFPNILVSLMPGWDHCTVPFQYRVGIIYQKLNTFLEIVIVWKVGKEKREFLNWTFSLSPGAKVSKMTLQKRL